MNVLRDRVTPYSFIKMKRKGEKIVMVTAYTYYQARVADEAGVDGLLVGDSLGMVVMGYDSTLPVTLDEVIHHLRAVVNARPKALIVADMPFMTYEASKEDALRNAGKLIKVGADAVKVEGGEEVIDTVNALVKAGIPVMGHVGLNPQRHLVIGGYRLRGKRAEEALEIIESAKALEDAGAFAVVIENTVAEVAEEITKTLKIPTICIGAGPVCDGQILVIHDLLGINPTPPPFARKYANLYELMVDALRRYASDVRVGRFPGEGEFWRMREDERTKLKRLISKSEVTSDKRENIKD